MNFTKFLNKSYCYALVGASNNKDKYGYKIMQDLLNAGYINIIPINPKENIIFEKQVFKSITDVVQKIDVVIFVVPGNSTESVLMDVKKLGIDKVWMQPGSETDIAIEFCKTNGIDMIYNACVMIQKNNV